MWNMRPESMMRGCRTQSPGKQWPCMVRCACSCVLMGDSMQDKPMPHAIRAIQTEEKAMKELGVKYGAGNVRLVKADEAYRRS